MKLHYWKGKVALVSGGDSGIGRSICRHFTLEGATAAFTYVKELEDSGAAATLEMLMEDKNTAQSAAKNPIALPADRGFENDCKRVVDQVANACGQIDILVNNAAEMHMHANVNEITDELLEREFRNNVFSYFYMTKYAVKHMNKGSSIINTTSVNTYKGNKKLLDCTSTKGAVVAFNRAVALQINAATPGPVWTPLVVASYYTGQALHPNGGVIVNG